MQGEPTLLCSASLEGGLDGFLARRFDEVGSNDAYGISLQIQQIVSVTVAGFEGKLTDRKGFRNIVTTEITDKPACRFKQPINFYSGFVFRPGRTHRAFYSLLERSIRAALQLRRA
jgi:hypothetical protein